VCAPGTTDRFVATPLPGEHHGGKGVAVAIAGAEVATIAWDDKLRIAEIATEEFIAAVPTEGQPRGVAVSATNSSLQFVITSGAVKSFLRGVCVSTLAVSDYAPTAISASADGSKIAVGGDDAKVHLYSVGAGGVLTATGESRGVGTAISVIAFSPDGSVIVTGDTTRDVRLYSGVDVSVLKSGKWQAHTTRVTGLAWHPSGSVRVYNVD
jgi:WD repeat-containing protein 1 (actin-interacting protein 1)